MLPKGAHIVATAVLTVVSCQKFHKSPNLVTLVIETFVPSESNNSISIILKDLVTNNPDTIKNGQKMFLTNINNHRRRRGEKNYSKLCYQIGRFIGLWATF